MQSIALTRIFQNAWEKRHALRIETTAFRLVNGKWSGCPGLVVDFYSGRLVISAYSTWVLEEYSRILPILVELASATGAVLKDRTQKPGIGEPSTRILWGDCPSSLRVREGPLVFEVDLLHTQNVGLFMDTRPLRKILMETCSDQDVLNLFSYTCSLGVAASLRNQGIVTNVDISPTYLARGKVNYDLNSLGGSPAALQRARFVKMDSERYLDWALKRQIRFHCIILDPPSFSRSKEGTFTFSRDYWRLVRKCALILKEGGRLFSLTNYGGIGEEEFLNKLEYCLERTRITGSRTILPPPDFEMGTRKAETEKEGEGSLIMIETHIS